jgi:TPP-dependent trihydroxycyclohexane-1,2-dione (THcHDO) dehydratase
MEVTKEMVVESINTYCTERKYGSETLTDDFKEKFSNIFVKKYDKQDVEESDVIADLKFNLDTAFNASLGLKNVQDADFTKKEDDYKKQI